MRQWYVLRSKPRKEVAAAAMLASLDIEVYLPTVRSRQTGGRTIAAELLFPGYLFGRLDPERFEVGLVNRTAGILYVLGCGDEPSSVPDELVSSIRNRLATGSRWDVVGTFRSGDHVVIFKGPFAGIEAVFDGYLSAAGRVRVLIKTLQSVYRAQLNVTELRTTRKAVERATA
jgi:transcriptional antiterminator RfaH